MKPSRWTQWLWVFLPLALGSLASVLAQTFWSPVPVLSVRIDVGMVLFFLGLISSAIIGAWAAGDWYRRYRTRRLLEDIRRGEQERRQRFLRRLDHEIKNPLTGLQAALVNLREATDGSDRQRAEQNARGAVERLSRLLADLRKLSDLEERPLERLPVDVPELLEEMVDAARSIPAYAARDVSLLVTRVPWPLPHVVGDRDLLGLAIYNLVDNALKFSGDGDPIEVRALEDGRALVVEVADSGPGLAPEDLTRIFEELYRGANARGVEGSGLGLALVRRIVDLHGGEINVRSRQGASRGTVFTIRLPVTKL